jgi:hypothetical protein
MNVETLKAQLDTALRENLMIRIGICDEVSLDMLDAIAPLEQPWELYPSVTHEPIPSRLQPCPETTSWPESA